MIVRSRLAAAVLPLLLLSAADVASADDAPPLGARFDTGSDLVSFKPPLDSKAVDKPDLNEIARFENPGKRWVISFAKTELPRDQPLKDSSGEHGGTTPGYLSNAVSTLRATPGGADVLRNEAINLGDVPVGVVVAQITDKNKPVLLQEAFVQVSPRVYYSIAMTAPCPAKDLASDPAVVEAGQLFKAMTDSIERVDLTAVREDQEDRLIRTRALLVNWNQKHLAAALQTEQYLLFKREGKPVGYAYVVEQPADAIPKAGEVEKGVIPNASDVAGLRVGLRTRLLTEVPKSVDAESWMYVSFDRRHEVWSNVTLVNNPAGRSEKEKLTWFSEVGATDIRRERVFDTDLRPEDFKRMDERTKLDKNAGVPFREMDKYRLTVRTEGRSAVAAPLQRELPPFYLPQALGYLLPHIVPLNYPTGYMFATYSGDNREVMARYVDVKPECDITFGGKDYRAVPVVDRVGRLGEPTTHYLTAAGDYIGSVVEATKMEIMPSNREAIITAFKDANLTQPGGIKE